MLNSYINLLKNILHPDSDSSISQVFTAIGLGYRVILLFVIVGVLLGSLLMLPKKIVSKLTARYVMVLNNRTSTLAERDKASDRIMVISILVWCASILLYVPVLIPILIWIIFH